MAEARVLLVIPPGLAGTTPNREGAAGLGTVSQGEQGFCYPPHTVAAVASALVAGGHSVVVLDAVAEGLSLAEKGRSPAVERVLALCAKSRVDLVGVFVSWATREADATFLMTLKRVRDEARLRGADGEGKVTPVAAFGVGVAHMSEELLAADHVLEGEPELSFVALASRVAEGASLSWALTPHNLGQDGYDDEGLLSDLDALPFPAWDRLDHSLYPYLTVLGSRGCTGGCCWCPYVVAQGRRFRACSAERVVDELAHLVKHYAPPRIVLRDPVMAHDRGRVEALCAAIARHRTLAPGRNLLWECESRPEHLDPALLRRMNLAGCVGIKIGLETLDEELLATLGRLQPGWDGERYRRHLATVVRACQVTGIAPRLFALTGLPGQTAAMVAEVNRFAARLGVADLALQQLKRYPGHRLDEATERLGAPMFDEEMPGTRGVPDAKVPGTSSPNGATPPPMVRAGQLLWRGWRTARRAIYRGES
jgi:radical SAM superfamily enzyme YgiQ (UPF0313 family)